MSGGVQARFFDLKDLETGPAKQVPGTVEQTNFATDSESNTLELYSGEFALAYSRWGVSLEGTVGKRTARFRSDGEIESFGVFTTGNFVQLQFSNGSAFEGSGNIEGYTLSYRVPQVPVSVFVGRRYSKLDGMTDSFGRSVGSVADFGAPSARFRSFARLAYEKMKWEIAGPPTGGAGFAGTIGTLTTSGFASAGIGRAEVDG
ncbi:MAG: hypothetical protein HOP12_02425 [Candidatus Eisenbacteria bacterium]|uniref:Porin n=1 Tax=Eiseniibacteriota bacterium TaxID=2212470 RepID=A0A849SEZ1_UNCEI|nr:hypothetical protein [Candidatus Eisenbacteria bacterium]